MKNLNLSLGQHNYLETGDPKFQLNPLLGTPDFALAAEVVEYLSHEAGVLRLCQGTKACVLFHLNQVKYNFINIDMTKMVTFSYNCPK